jgi:hypothetical protein
MTRRKKPRNKTIAKKAIEKAKEDFKNVRLEGCDELMGELFPHSFDDDFVFPNDLDKIHPVQINGNLTIQFPD